MKPITKILYSRCMRMQNNWGAIIRNLSLWFRVDTDHLSVVPNRFHQLVQIPLVCSADGDMMRHLIDDVEFLNRQLIDFIQNINAGNISSISFDDVDQLINGGVTATNNICAHDAILSTYSLNYRSGQISLGNHGLKVDRPFLSSSTGNNNSFEYTVH